jgi:type IV pilus assembly protein PilW
VKSARKGLLGGFSAIELLVSLALSGVLLLGVFALFVGSRKSEAMAEIRSQIQEAGYRAIDVITRDVRNAGYPGCENALVAAALDTSASVAEGVSVRGVQYLPQQQTWSAALPSDISPDRDSDVLFVQGVVAGRPQLTLLEAMSSPDAPLRIAASGTRQVAVGESFLIHNCAARAYFTVSGIDGDRITHSAASEAGETTHSLGYAFEAGSRMLPIHSSLYYVAPSASGASHALWRYRRGEPMLVATDVERLKVRFGVDAEMDGVIDEYRPAVDVTDWRTVTAVQVEIVVRSRETIASEIQREIGDTHSNGPIDGHLRNVFSAIATLRNTATQLGAL